MSSDGEYKPKNDARGQGRGSANTTDEDPFIIDENSGVDATREDREAAKSESTGRIAQSEIDDLRASAGDQMTTSRRRGVKNDAMRQEREVDEIIDNLGEDRV